MWLYRCIFILLPYIVNCVQDNVHVQPRSEDSELVFTDVIKNISRVNNILQELINNYEQLKKLYKSQESSKTVESTEIDEVFKAKQRSKNRSKTTKKPPPIGEFPATQMFWSDDEDKSDSASVTSEKGKISKKVVAAKDTKKMQGENSYSYLSTVESTDVSSENGKKNSKTKQNKPELKNKSKIVFIDTHKTAKKTAEVKPMMESPLKTSKHVDSKTIKSIDKTIKNTRNVQKVVHTELFSKHNIWNEILNNKPIRLQKFYPNYDLARNGIKRPNLRSYGSIANGVQAANNNKNIKDKPDASFDQTEDEVVIKKEQFKTDVLRTAYGDACLKLVVTKCNKACKAAGKSVCHSHKCKSDFKDNYKSASRRGCRKEFRGEDPNDDVTSEKASSKQSRINYRGVTTDTKGENNDFIDLTRGGRGYLSAACLPAGQDKVELQKQASLRNETLVPLKTNPNMTINILRDRYEEACKKISAGKCRKACAYAYEKACEDDDTCNNKTKKAFKKVCRRECKSAYKLRHDDGGSDYYSDLDNDKSWSI